MWTVLKRRLESKAKDCNSRHQFGFKKGYGARDAIEVLGMLFERSIELGNEVSVCFVSYDKAFDRVNWVKLLKILKRIGLEITLQRKKAINKFIPTTIGSDWS